MYSEQTPIDPKRYENEHYISHHKQPSLVENRNKEAGYCHPSNTSSFTSSPETCSTEMDLQSSCESLSAAFSQTSLNTQYGPNYLEPLDEYLDDPDDPQEYETPSAETILFYEILQDFPDLATFVCHEEFGVFAQLWVDLQQNIRIAKRPSRRPAVQSWLKGAALQIHFLLVSIVKANPGNNDLKSEPRCIFSAFRRLKDRIEIMHEVFELIENGRVWFNQTPSQAIAPLFKAASEIEKDITHFKNNPEVLPLVDPSNDRVELVDAKDVTMKDLSNRVLHSYNIMPYSSDSGAVNIPKQQEHRSSNMSSLQQDHSTYVPFTDDFIHPSASGYSTPVPPIQNTNLDSYILSEEWLQQQDSALGNTTVKSNPNHQLHEQQNAPFSHIQPAWIHPSDVWSMSVTPYDSSTKVDTTTTSPTCTQDEDMIAGTIYTPSNTLCNLSLSPNPATTTDTGCTENHSPLNTFSEDNSDYEDSISIKDDDDYVASDADDDEDWKESSSFRRKSKRAIAATVAAAININKTGQEQDVQKSQSVTLRKRKPQQTKERPLRRVNERHYTRRTATSYDSKTTHYLKTVFFDIYSSRDKLTKEQRRQVQKDTGLKPRNITYWFSNHKRRFQTSLAVYKKVVKESHGKIQSYDDFLNWRRSQGLPDEVLDAEAVGLDLVGTGKHTLVLSKQEN